MQASGGDQVAVDELVTKAQEGDAVSFAKLYEHFFDQILRYVNFKTGSLPDAEDITGQVFVRMLESIHTFKRQGHPFSSWLFRIAHNLVVDHFRVNSRKKVVPLEDTPAAMRVLSPDLDSQVDLDLSMQEVNRAMVHLTELQREVISLRFAAGLSVLETARAVGRKENAVKALQHAGLQKLRGMLAPESSVPVAVRHRQA